uniref:Uncharacterized protein n=1 Tax=Mirabilis jalapa TaxID=3538 RepID=A0A7T7JNS3_MIRJA|nr:hypothetical protein KYW51_mgp15 [Mirabilis jalapa]QQL93537.1 hypothetical protein [Mirabilis jalapa]
MSYISGARLVDDKQVKIASSKMDGIGPKNLIISLFLLSTTIIFFSLIWNLLYLEKIVSSQELLIKAVISAGSRELATLFIKCCGAGSSGPLVLIIASLVRILGHAAFSGNFMTDPGSDEAGEGRGFRWTDLFGSCSPSNSEASINQPAPDSPNPGEPAAPIAEVYHPLQEEGQRRRELSDRLSINTIERPLPDSLFQTIIDTQFQTELKIEKALRSDRVVPEDSIFDKRHQIRGFLFYPNGRAFSLETYQDHLNKIENHGTHRSLPYRRLLDAIDRKEFELDFLGLKKRRDW